MKIYPEPTDLVPVIEKLKAQGKVVVFANGCFELIHVGHVRYLTAARALGDVLIVAVNTDGSVKKIKPDRDPVNPDVERMEILASLEAVTFVVPLADETPFSLLEMLKPDIHTKGTDYTLETIPERAIVEGYGGRVELVGGPKVRNTSDMLDELKKR